MLKLSLKWWHHVFNSKQAVNKAVRDNSNEKHKGKITD